ncbi:type II toxin-antitoxin system ParD family antitoxin [Nocardia sp. CA-107356]|uniref:type II toxin-antitoxin system ParD family antitoxin n=1 Tax=Nocardia sp. CA-107356 TaxID=3239972 RepID=UPI003D8D85C2
MNHSRDSAADALHEKLVAAYGPDFSIDDFRPDPDTAPMEPPPPPPPPPPLPQENAEQLLREALIGGENSGDPTPVDFDAFLARKRDQTSEQ